jgi:uncharacterized protein
VVISVVAFTLAIAAPIAWQPWSRDVFDRAQSEKKFVLLDLGAVWCHWCHVMDEVTYQDPLVVELIGASFIAVRADQDQHPDLANRYEDYGWPATIVFAPDGSELVKRRGYMNPTWFASMLRAIVADPTPGPSVTNPPRAETTPLRMRLDAAYDRVHGGWGSIHKYIDIDAMELTLLEENETIARQTLDANLALIDPADGGVYQYSDLRKPQAPWSSPHREKIMYFQAQEIRLYARAAKIFDEPRYLATAQKIAAYVKTKLMREDGLFYASQNADPPYAIDQRTFARENGWAVAAFAELGELDVAARAGSKLEELIRPSFLIDTLSAGTAYLALYRATGDQAWLERAIAAAKTIDRSFRDREAGYITAPVPAGAIGVLAKPVRQIDENVAIARFANLLAHGTKDESLRAVGEHAMRFLRSSETTGKRMLLAGILLAEAEREKAPLHITVRGRRADPAARALHDAARSHPRVYAWVEWKDGDRAIAYACEGSVCSAPARTPAELQAALRSLCDTPTSKL